MKKNGAPIICSICGTHCILYNLDGENLCHHCYNVTVAENRDSWDDDDQPPVLD